MMQPYAYDIWASEKGVLIVRLVTAHWRLARYSVFVSNGQFARYKQMQCKFVYLLIMIVVKRFITRLTS